MWATIQPIEFIGSRRRAPSASGVPRTARRNSERVNRSWSTSGGTA
jgi:hypothetical protein